MRKLKMPYIIQKARPKIDVIIEDLPELNDGELNYTITKICHRFIQIHKFKYMTLARVIGGLICVVLELYRCVAAPYEDKKKEENGCISDLDRITEDEKQAIWDCQECRNIFKTNEFNKVCSSKIIIYQCPRCRADKSDCIEIRKAID